MLTTSYDQHTQNVHVHGSVKLSDGVKIKNRNHTYVLSLFSWSLTKISVDILARTDCPLKKAGNYSVGSCTKYLVVRERNRNKTKLVTLNVTATKGNVRLT